MVDRPIVLIRLHDPARAEVLAATLEAGGDMLAVADAAIDAADVVVAQVGRAIHVSAVDHEKPDAVLAMPADDALVAAAVRLVAAGYVIEAARPVDDEPNLDDHEPPQAPGARARPMLSARELEVLALLAEGAANKVIARALNISVHTAKFHIASLLTKLGAVNRTDALAIAMREGLISM